jgi:putative membrane protein
MKKNVSLLAMACISIAAVSCNESGSNQSSNADSNAMTASPTTDSTDRMNNSQSTTPNTTTSAAPLGREDSTFVMKAAAGGMMEVEAGNLAQSNGNSQRVKDFGAMMVRDHSQANTELMSLASSRGLTVPATLPADMQKHMDAMRKLKGKAFDQHYISMMNDDHKKDIAEFKKAASSAADADLKTWAGNKLPVLQTHLDSAMALKKAKL